MNTKQIMMRTLALTTVAATVLIGGLPGTAYCGECMDNFRTSGAVPGYDDYFRAGVPQPTFEVWKCPSGEFLVRSAGGVPNHLISTGYDQRGKIEFQRDCCYCNPQEPTLLTCTDTTYDDQGNSTTVMGDPSAGQQEVILKDVNGVIISDTTNTYDQLGNIKTAISKDKCGKIINQITCTYTYDDKGVASRWCTGSTQAPAPGWGLATGGTAGAPGSGPAAGGRAGVVETNAAVVRHPGQSIKGLKRAQGGAAPSGGTAGVASPGTTTSSGDSGFATGGTAGVAETSATPSGGGNSANGGTAAVAGTNRGEPQREPTPNSRNKKSIKRTVTNVGSSSSAENSAVGGTAGVAGPATPTPSGGSGTSRRKSHSKKSLGAASSTANIQGSGQSTESAQPAATPSPRKKKHSSDQP